jgi:hypothetical protein
MNRFPTLSSYCQPTIPVDEPSFSFSSSYSSLSSSGTRRNETRRRRLFHFKNCRTRKRRLSIPTLTHAAHQRYIKTKKDARNHIEAECTPSKYFGFVFFCIEWNCAMRHDPLAFVRSSTEKQSFPFFFERKFLRRVKRIVIKPKGFVVVVVGMMERTKEDRLVGAVLRLQMCH